MIIQIIYKGLYLAVEVLPKLIRGEKVAIGLSVFFLVWVIVLPFVVPWRKLIKPKSVDVTSGVV